MTVTNTLSTFEYYVAEHTDNGMSRIPERVATDAVRRLSALEVENAKMREVMHRLSDMSVDVAVHLSGDERRAFGRIVNEADAIIGRTWLPPMSEGMQPAAGETIRTTQHGSMEDASVTVQSAVDASSPNT